MKRLIWLVILVAIAVVMGIWLFQYPGFILIQVGTHSVAMPLWFTVISLFLLAFILRWAVRGIASLWRAPKQFLHWKQRWQTQKKHKKHVLLIATFLSEQFSVVAQMFFNTQASTTEQLAVARAALMVGDIETTQKQLQQITADAGAESLAKTLIEIDLAQHQNSATAWQLMQTALVQNHYVEPILKRLVECTSQSIFDATFIQSVTTDLMRNSDSRLVWVYSCFEQDDAAHALKKIEKWCKKYRLDSHSHAALAQAKARAEIDAQVEYHFTESLKLDDYIYIRRAYAEWLVKQGKLQQALGLFI